MAYEKTVWEPGVTPLSADNMNHIEDGILEVEEGIKNKFKTVTLTAALESLKAGTYTSIVIPHTVPVGYSFAGAIITGNGWTNGMISYVVYSSNSQIVVGNYAISGDQANKTIALTAIYIKN